MHPATHTRRCNAFISHHHADNTQEGRRWTEWMNCARECCAFPPHLVGTKLRGLPFRDSICFP